MRNVVCTKVLKIYVPDYTKGLGMTGCGPVSVPSSEPKGRLTCFVALVEGAVYIMPADKNANTEEFIKFCEMLLRLFGKLALRVDNASYHKSKKFRKFLRKNRDRLRVNYLPEYTPALSVSETEMGPIKRAVAKRSPKDKEGVWSALCDAAAAGDIPVNKLFGWMRIRDPDPGPTVLAPKYEYDGELIIVRSDSPPEAPPERARIRSPPEEDLTLEEFKSLPKSIFDPGGTLLKPFMSLPTNALRKLPVGLYTP